MTRSAHARRPDLARAAMNAATAEAARRGVPMSDNRDRTKWVRRSIEAGVPVAGASSQRPPRRAGVDTNFHRAGARLSDSMTRFSCLRAMRSSARTFDQIPSGCLLTTVGGSRVTYAASKNITDNKETPISAASKIDRSQGAGGALTANS